MEILEENSEGTKCRINEWKLTEIPTGISIGITRRIQATLKKFHDKCLK